MCGACQTQISQAQSAKQLAPSEDDDIVDNNEIDTNNNLDSDWAITISRTYRSSELRKWRLAPVVPSVHGRPGEMGKLLTNLVTHATCVYLRQHIWTAINSMRFQSPFFHRQTGPHTERAASGNEGKIQRESIQFNG